MNRSSFLLASLAVVATSSAQTGTPVWATLGRTSTHRATAPAATQTPGQVLWSTSVDNNRQYAGGGLLIHYGTALITHNNIICVPLKTGATDGWAVKGMNATTGALIYTFPTDYSIPSYTGLDWTPEFGPALSPDGRLYVPAAGGTILVRDNPESASSTSTRLVFYGSSNFTFNKSLYSSNVKICTPLSIDPFGNIYFGFMTFGGTLDRTKIGSAGLISGVARVTPNGVGTWRSVTSITGDPNTTHVQFNCAPAISQDGTMMYVGIKIAGGGGYLVGLDPTTLALRARRKLFDPTTGNNAGLIDQSSATPMIGPDGDVYFGVIGNPHIAHDLRGYMLHFDKMLLTQKPSGSFGWDNTASFVPSSAIANYGTTSPYLVLTKYNDYAGWNKGQGINRVAILDPNKTSLDSISGQQLMKEVITVVGVTPDAEFTATFPNAVREWCINSAVVDTITKSAIVNSEDGHIYKWDFQSNTLSPGILLNGPLGQAYTPTISGPTGISYAINNGILFAVGS